MVVSQFFSPLRTLKKVRKASSASSESVGDDGGSDGSGGRDKQSEQTTELVAGLCFCCSRKVAFPASVTCFKCTVCDTINDLRAVTRVERVVASDGSVASRACAPPPPLTLDRLRAGIQAYRRHPDKQGLLEAMLRESFGNWDVLNVSFPAPTATGTAGDGLTVSVDDVHAAYKLILALPAPFIRATMGGIEQILRRPGRPLRQKSDVRYLVIVLENPLLLQQSFAHEASYHHRIVKSIVGTLANLPPHVHYALVLWSAQNGHSALRRKIALVGQFISYRLQKYDRARRRTQASQAQRAAAAQLTAYSSSSNQTELPAFQRIRSITNAPLPPHAVGSSARPASHVRMRSNTDSRVSLSSRDRSFAVSRTAAKQQQQLPPLPPHDSAIAPSDTHRAGLGIAMCSDDAAASEIGGARLSRRDAAPRIATAPEQLLMRTAALHIGSSNGNAPPLSKHAVASSKSSPTLKATSTGDGMTSFVPIVSPELQPGQDSGGVFPRNSVLGVLDGTAEPRVSRTAGSRGSLTRTRSSSEAPARRRGNGISAVRGAPSGSSVSHAVGDWGGGVDLDDYYAGADGVLYPKTSALVMYQNDWRLVAAAKVMALLHAANLLLPAKTRLPIDVFYNSAIESMDLMADYDVWQARTPGAFSFCQYPFLLSLAAKVQIMQVDAARQMDSKLKEAVMSALFQSFRVPSALADQPHLKLLVRRHCLVEDSLHQLASHEQDLKKRLKIEFVGEEGIDAGGLTKEWFMLLLRELLNPMYGMFTREPCGGSFDGDDSSSDASWAAAYWFNPASLEASNQYFLVGVVVGLALYNSNILDLQLPLAVFKKLLRTSFYHAHHSIPTAAASASAAVFSASSVSPVMSAARPVDTVAKGSSSSKGNGTLTAIATSTATTLSGSIGGGGNAPDGRSPIYGLLSSSAQLRYQINEMLSDVSQFRPQLARGLRQLLLYRADDVDSVFCLTFEASYDALGQVVTVPLVPNGATVAVTSANRVEYVLRYLQWVLNDSVARQFEPFRRGFYYVCGGNALSLFKPEEIELMVHGSGSDWNPEDLRKITEHINFGSSDLLVGWFWDTLTEFTPEDRRIFLSFVTGADRMPTIASELQLKMKLVLLGDDYIRLPVARTCFNQLGIWRYRSKGELKTKLVLAIRESEGFGLE
ncbi:putative E3 ubiquitin-protein ligase [Coemansia sp. RSA 1933]|nr:putative E3 ubiquitin-protein ligase [Coemansia sp. RSA 1933]